MIAVVADDLTGAAELGGVGLRYNLRVEICTEVPVDHQAELLVIATDTRSGTMQEAMAETAVITSRLLVFKPDLLFKKIDSVLRGHVLAEVQAQLAVLGLKRALIVAANPALGRTIVNGQYYFHGEPIHTSGFAHDPEFAITSSGVAAMLRSNSTPVHIIQCHEPMPEEGIIVGEVQHTADLEAWAKRVETDTMVVGASGFFAALLDARFGKQDNKTSDFPALSGPALYVSGSTFLQSRLAIQHEKNKGGPVSYMPETIVSGKEPEEILFDAWSKEVASYVHDYAKAIIAIDPDSTRGTDVVAGVLRSYTARITKKVLQQATICELFIEGGATAWAVLQQAEFSTLQPVREMAPGVIRMRVHNKKGLYLTIKPGSYHWPEPILRFIYNR